jgi:hypothetical protein
MAKKAEIFESKLSQADLITLAYIIKKDVEKEVNEQVDKQVYAINQSLTTCISAAIFDFTDLSNSEVEEIIARSNEYMKDSEEFLIKYKEEWIMKINEIKPKIKEESIKLLEGKKNQEQSIKALREIFKDVPTKDLVNTFKEAKEEWCKKCAELTPEDKEILAKKGRIPHPENKIKSKEKDSSQVIIPKEEKKGNSKAICGENERLKHLNNIFRPTKFQGAFHNYEKVDEGLKVGSKVFKGLEDLNKYKTEELAEMQKQIDLFNSKIEEVEAAFEYLNMR